MRTSRDQASTAVRCAGSRFLRGSETLHIPRQLIRSGCEARRTETRSPSTTSTMELEASPQRPLNAAVIGISFRRLVRTAQIWPPWASIIVAADGYTDSIRAAWCVRRVQKAPPAPVRRPMPESDGTITPRDISYSGDCHSPGVGYATTTDCLDSVNSTRLSTPAVS